MSRLRIAGIVAALALAGCSDDSSGVTEGSVPFKSGNVEQLGPLREQMEANIKNRPYTKKQVIEEKSSKESKGSSEGKPQEKKP